MLSFFSYLGSSQAGMSVLEAGGMTTDDAQMLEVSRSHWFESPHRREPSSERCVSNQTLRYGIVQRKTS